MITLTQEHLIQLVALFEAIDHNPQFTPHPFDARTAYQICTHPGKDKYYAFQAGKQLLGYALLRGWNEGYTTPSLGLAVHPDHQHRGLGHLLLQHLLAEACTAGAKDIRLTVHPDNAIAQKFYATYGFSLANQSGKIVGKRSLETNPLGKELLTRRLKPGTIYVQQIPDFGDTIQATALIRHCRNEWPQTPITWGISSECVSEHVPFARQQNIDLLPLPRPESPRDCADWAQHAESITAPVIAGYSAVSRA